MLLSINKVVTPHRYNSSDRRVKPVELCVIHYTASPYSSAHGGSNEKRITNWMSGRGRKSSTHFTVLRNGKVIQAADLDERTWHAGGSEFKDPTGKKITSINFRSIGLDFDNVGMLYKCDGGFVDSYGRAHLRKNPDSRPRLYTGPEPYVHTNEKGKMSYWEPYSRESLEVMKALLYKISCEFCELVDEGWRIVGHEDIKSTKSDPGPACPMDELRSVFSADFDTDTLEVSDLFLA